MTLQALAMPAKVVFCETCCRWTPEVAGGLGWCGLYQGWAGLALAWRLEMSLCGEYRDHERTKTTRRLNEHRRAPLVPHMGHHMGDEATCSNHRPGQPHLACGVSWAEHRETQTPCLFPRPIYSSGRWTDPKLAAEAARARGKKPADALAMDIAEGWAKP